VVEAFSVDALEQAFSDRVCALVMEPIQGEGGIVPLAAEFLRAARELCTRHDALLIFDEIQCGMGRTGRYFAYQHYGIEPDLVTLAKALAAGYPLGAVIGNARAADSLKPGDHGTTFGGGPLACRLALEVLDVIHDEGLLENVAAMGVRLVRGLQALAAKHAVLGPIRGVGLMVGVELGPLAKPVVARLLEHGVLANAAHETVLRILPPFIVSAAEIDHFLTVLDSVLSEVQNEPAGGAGGN
jgi:acetylornithine/N-succinyldiaminopimelate aminotransferase